MQKKIALFYLLTSVNVIAQNVYIGNQIWMNKNLDVNTFRNNEVILEAKTNEEWAYAERYKVPAWCYYNNDGQFGSELGKLYNWYAVIDNRNICPDGWHVPNTEEWNYLINFLDTNSVADNKNNSVAKKIKSVYTDGPESLIWQDQKYIREIQSNVELLKWIPFIATNEIGFNAYPCGSRIRNNFFGAGYHTIWWSLDEEDTDDGDSFLIHSKNPNSLFKETGTDKGSGCSVRCIKDY
jgi:uncharacterized protein (TIGR02145 family)